MIRRLLWFKMLFAIALLQLACDNKEEIGLYSIYQLDKYKTPKPVIDLDTTIWDKQQGLMSTFPKGIAVYKSNQTVNGKATNMYILAFNPKLNLEFKPIMSTTAKTPSTFFSEEAGEVYACLNGGFFGTGASYSLVLFNGIKSADNIKSLNRTLSGVSTPYYPTRAAFGLNKENKPSVSWIYTLSNGLYAYPQPSPNEEGKAPQAVPTASFPVGGDLWGQNSAIGGSPMLIKDSLLNITDVQELIAVDNTSSRARSAIGYLKNGNVVLFAAEGGNKDGAPGLTLKEVAQVMLEIGCVGAVNLDGGGSSSMVVDGVTTIKPSDVGGERKVVSAILVKKR